MSEHRDRRRPRISSALAIVPLLATAGCGNATANPTSAPPPAGTPTETTSASSGSAAPPSGTGDSPAAAVASWVNDVLEQHYQRACAAEVDAARQQQPGADVTALCAPGSMAMHVLTSLHDAWDKPGVTLPARIRVTEVATNGDTATVSDKNVLVDGRSLNDLMLVGARLGQGGSFGTTFTVSRTNGVWRLSDMNLGGDLGTVTASLPSTP
jgi:hypothetical protein